MTKKQEESKTTFTQDFKERVHQGQEKIVGGAKAVDQTVKKNPWKAFLAGIGIGAVIGLLRRRKK